MARGGSRPNTGGKRPNAGRKKGSGTKRTRKTNKLAQEAAGEGVQPLQVLLEAMRAHHAKGELDEAAKIAVAAAPYVHPRQGVLVVKGDGAGGEIPLGLRITSSPERKDADARSAEPRP